MSRIPQPTRLRQPAPSSASTSEATSRSTRKSFLSPKTLWSPSSPKRNTTAQSIPKYQIQDPGVVPGSPKVVKRGTIRPPNTAGKGNTISGNQGQTQPWISANTPNHHHDEDAVSSPSSNLAVVNSTFPPSPTPAPVTSRIPIPQRYFPVSTHIQVQESPSRVPALQSPIIPNKPHLRSGIPIPKPKFPTLIHQQNQDCHSPAISMCANVATVSPQSSPIPEPVPEPEPIFESGPVMTMPMDREGNSSSHESIYSSASAMALARYRKGKDKYDLEKIDTRTREIYGDEHDLSRISSTTSHSSASSLARHRLSQRQRQRQAQPMSSTTSTSSETEQALIWQPDPDPESMGYDPAENLWKEIEARLNRRSCPEGEGRDERGQWILTSRQKEPHRRQMMDEPPVSSESIEMKKQESEFTISAYFDPDLSTPLIHPSRSISRSRSREMGMAGTAIFDMPAPLIISTSQTGHGNVHGDRDRDDEGEGYGSVGKTPANTPLIHHETIQRVCRVRKSTLGIQSVDMGSRRSGSGSSSRRSRMNIHTIHPERTSITRSRSDSSIAVVDLVPEPLPPSSTTASPQIPTQTRISSHFGPKSPDKVDLDLRSRNHSQADDFHAWENSSKANSDHDHDHDIGEKYTAVGMTRLDSHVQAALEELSDTQSQLTYTDTDRTPIAKHEHMLGADRDRDRYLDPLYVEHYENEAVLEGEIEMGESTPMPIPAPFLRHRFRHSAEDGYDSKMRSCSPPPLALKEGEGESEMGERSGEDVGLGMGLDLYLDSVYRLRIPLPLPSPSPSTPSRSSSPLSRPSYISPPPSASSRSTSSASTSRCSSRSGSNTLSRSDTISPRPLSIDDSQNDRPDSEYSLGVKSGQIQDGTYLPLVSVSNSEHQASKGDPYQPVEDTHHGGNQGEEEEKEEEEEEMLTITDLDTGHRVDLSIKRLDEFELWRL